MENTLSQETASVEHAGEIAANANRVLTEEGLTNSEENIQKALAKRHFLLESTRQTFLQIAIPLVEKFDRDIRLLEDAAQSFEEIPGDEIDREINKRCARDLRSRCSELVLQQSCELERLAKEAGVGENRLIAEIGITVCRTYLEVNFSFGYTMRRIVLWADGRYFLIVYKQMALQDDNLEEVRYTVFDSPSVERVISSVEKFSDAELAAIKEFRKGTNTGIIYNGR
ncbi:MAG: hypothetical protein P4L53_03755 [Candidatus Obscuribacterales bacterium]|nr:hypothetical protein [Candidatus Obscuribacterales bacterium]